MDEEKDEGVAGLESGATELEGKDSAAASEDYAGLLDRAPVLAEPLTQIDTADLASAAAELDVRVKRMETEVKRRKARLDEVKKALCDRMVQGGISGVRVTTTDGKKLVHIASIVAAGVVAAKKGEMVDWLQQRHKELLFVGYNDAELRSKLESWRRSQEGEFPQELLDRGVIRLFEGSEVRFRKSGK